MGASFMGSQQSVCNRALLLKVTVGFKCEVTMEQFWIETPSASQVKGFFTKAKDAHFCLFIKSVSGTVRFESHLVN
jgi:hypothetical protein